MNNSKNLFIAAIITLLVLGIGGLVAANLQLASANTAVVANDAVVEMPVQNVAPAAYTGGYEAYEEEEEYEEYEDEEEYEEEEYEEAEYEEYEGHDEDDDEYESNQEQLVAQAGCEYEFEDGEWELECEDDD